MADRPTTTTAATAQRASEEMGAQGKKCWGSIDLWDYALSGDGKTAFFFFFLSLIILVEFVPKSCQCLGFGEGVRVSQIGAC